MRAGAAACYVVTDDPDAVFAQAREAGAEIVEPPHNTAFGHARVHRPRSGAQPVDVRQLRGAA